MLYGILMPIFIKGQDSSYTLKSDSITFSRFTVNGELSASYISQRNWGNENLSIFSFLGNGSIRHRLVRSSGWEHNHTFQTSISYIRYADSIWLNKSCYAFWH